MENLRLMLIFIGLTFWLIYIVSKLPTTFPKMRNRQDDVTSSSLIVVSQPSYCHPVPRKLRSKTHKDPLQDCSLPYVSINDGGRLGNKICQYASVWLLREIFGIRVAVWNKIHRRILNIFENLQIPIVNEACHSPGAIHIGFDDLYQDLLSNYTTNVRLQMSYYINNSACPRDLMWLYRDKLRKELVFKSSSLKMAKDKINDTLRALRTTRENVTIVTVHVRRTDYKIWLKKRANADLISKQYFKRTFSFYRETLKNPLFLVLSDDSKWCKDHLQDHDVKIASSKYPSIDFVLLSLGDHHIRSVGTYGFTSAMLGHGSMVYPYNYSKLITYEDGFNCSDVRSLATLHPINAGNPSVQLH